MKSIHKKSAIARTAEIILACHERGEGLLWGRYERQIPLCAFTDNGLSCRKCLNGPCRINPFGDEPDRGVCGADRDQIVMENLFQATREGVFETARSVSSLQGATPEWPDIALDMPFETQKRLSEKGLIPVRREQLHEACNSYFSHKGYLSRTLMDLTRLGLIHYGFLKMGQALSGEIAGHAGSFDSEGPNILLVGQASLDLIRSLLHRAKSPDGGKRVNLFVQGAKAMPSLHSLSDHGSAELALAMNPDALILTPGASLPGLEDLAKRFDVPVILIDEKKGTERIALEAVEAASRHRQNASFPASSRMTLTTRQQEPRGQALDKAEAIRAALEGGRIDGIVAILGETNVKQAFYERTLTLMENCVDRKFLVLVGGELAAQADLLDEELAKRLAGRLPALVHELEKDGLKPVIYLGSNDDIPNVVSLFKDLSDGRGFDRIPVGIAFPEFWRASTWAAAVSLLSLGFSVQVGTQLPFWGSPSLTEILLKDWPGLSGGTLLASPSLPDSQTQAHELLSLLETRKTR